MAADPEELERILATDQRLGRAQPREELTRQAKQDFPPDPQAGGTPFIGPRTLRGAADDAEALSQAGSSIVYELRGGDEDADVDDDKGMPDMSIEIKGMSTEI